MGKTTSTCKQIVIPGEMAPPVGATGLEVPVATQPVAIADPFEGDPRSSLKLEELVVPFHAWGSFFDVLPGQSVRIEAPEDEEQDYEVVPEYLKTTSVKYLERCTVMKEAEPVSQLSMAILAPTEVTHYWHFEVKEDAVP